jgi:hypothetical protein
MLLKKIAKKIVKAFWRKILSNYNFWEVVLFFYVLIMIKITLQSILILIFLILIVIGTLVLKCHRVSVTFKTKHYSEDKEKYRKIDLQNAIEKVLLDSWSDLFFVLFCKGYEMLIIWKALN